MVERRIELRCMVLIGGLMVCSAHAEPKGLMCQVRCSDTKLRTGIAELSWASPEGAAARTTAAPSLDVTVFRGGFDRGLYQTFGAIGERSAPQPQPGARPSASDDEARTRRAFDLKLSTPEKSPTARATAAAEATQTVEIENLEPGLLYRFRLRNAGIGDQEVTCEAPVCPADMKGGK